MSPGRLERHGFEHYRHGTLSLFAALNTRTGKVLGETVERHTSEDFVAFLGTIVASESRGKEILIRSLAEEAERENRRFAAARARELITVESNFRELFEGHRIHTNLYHGAVLGPGLFRSIPPRVRRVTVLF